MHPTSRYAPTSCRGRSRGCASYRTGPATSSFSATTSVAKATRRCRGKSASRHESARYHGAHDRLRAAGETLSERKRRFEQRVLPHLDAAYNLARWLTRNDHDAEDVVQEAVLRAYRFFDGLRGEARPWLLAIVRNSCFSWLQVNRPAELAGFDDRAPEPIDETSPETLAVRQCDRRMLNEALAALSAQLREALILRELEDLSYKDIARITDVPVGTVMSRLARGRRLLAESLQAISNAAARTITSHPPRSPRACAPRCLPHPKRRRALPGDDGSSRRRRSPRSRSSPGWLRSRPCGRARTSALRRRCSRATCARR